jgi:hypothetical protein
VILVILVQLVQQDLPAQLGQQDLPVLLEAAEQACQSV